MKKIVILMISIFLLVGCGNKENVKLKVECSGEVEEQTYKVGDVINCTLLGDEYDLEIKKITDKSVSLEASRYGLVEPNPSGSINLTKKIKKFVLKKDKKLELAMQVTDAHGMINIEWNE